MSSMAKFCLRDHLSVAPRSAQKDSLITFLFMEAGMKNLTRAIIAVVFALFVYSLPVGHAQQQQAASGTYKTYIGEQLLGTESYTSSVLPDNSRRTEAELAVGANKLKAVTVVAGQRPVSFTLEQGGALALSTQFGPGSVKITVPGKETREIASEPDVVLENLVWHQFIFLLEKYDAARGGRQSFKAFLPSQAIEYNVTLERVDAPRYSVRGRQVETVHYRIVASGNLLLELWTDAARTPLLLRVASQNLRVVREGAQELEAAVFPSPLVKADKADTNEAFTSEEVSFSNDDLKLAATLTMPKKGARPLPAAVIITGSGGQNRDGSNGVLNLYKLIAEHLSAAGVAVLRADDRGTGRSAAPTKPTSYRDLVNDSRAALAYLTTRPEIDKNRIALVGHSEGAETAIIIASEDARVAAVALLAGASRSIDKVALEQSLYTLALQEPLNPSDTSKLPALSRDILRMFDEAKANPKPAGPEADARSWFREHAASDPASIVRRVRCPVLILNGERDMNVLPYHAIELAQSLAQAGNKRVLVRIFPNLTHLFTPSALDSSVTGEKTSEVSTDFLRTLGTWATQVLAPGH